MLVLEASSATQLFLQAVARVLQSGVSVDPRGQGTRELMPAHLCLTEPRARVLDAACGRVINPAFAVAETVWILSGSDSPWIFDFNARLRCFADAGRLQGAYGPRLRNWLGVDQLDAVRRQLLRDRSSRRATVCLFDPARDHAGARDVPCTVTYGFYIREGRLQMHTTMRSQDLWLGFPYDLFAATVLQELMAHWCGVALGAYHLHVSSLHLYDEHLEPAARLKEPPPAGPITSNLGLPWEELNAMVDRLMLGVPVAAPGWNTFSGALDSYRLWKQDQPAAAMSLAAETPGALGRAMERWYDHLLARRQRTGPDPR